MTRVARLGALGALLLAACVPAPVVEEPVEAPERPARAVAGAAHYRVVDDGTLVYARVFRGGSLAKLGHNHVVVFDDVRGDIFVADSAGDSLFDLVVAPARVTVDPPALRQRQGRAFDTQISGDARSRTRRNMLSEEVLDASAHPHVTISSLSIEGPLDRPDVTMAVTIKGTTREVTLPVSVERDGRRLMATGEFELLQSEFGMTPFSVLGGALKVQDRIEVVFTIAAEQRTKRGRRD